MIVTLHSISHSLPYPQHQGEGFPPEYIAAARTVGEANLRLQQKKCSTNRKRTEQMIQDFFTPEQIQTWGIRITSCDFDMVMQPRPKKPDATHYNADPAYLYALIKQTGLTQQDIISLLGVKRRTLTNYLSGTTVPPYSFQYALEMLIK